MFVKDQMTPNPLTVAPDTPIIEAQATMQQRNIRHLPVVENNDSLVGLLNRETMLRAIPWSAGHLSAFETQYILSKIKARNVMVRDVITVAEDELVEEAARIMVDHKLTCLPVMRNQALVGIITDIDLLAITMEMLGARQHGLRLSVMVPNRVGEIARLSAAIAAIGGNLTAFGTWEGELDPASGHPKQMGIVLRAEEVSREQLMSVVEDLGDVEILNIRQV
ncbi:MAG: CBS and ACT domain-containing protein [Anaerolineae bacterium]